MSQVNVNEYKKPNITFLWMFDDITQRKSVRSFQQTPSSVELFSCSYFFANEFVNIEIHMKMQK
jgi:hypothetical protein